MYGEEEEEVGREAAKRKASAGKKEAMDDDSKVGGEQVREASVGGRRAGPAHLRRPCLWR